MILALKQLANIPLIFATVIVYPVMLALLGWPTRRTVWDARRKTCRVMDERWRLTDVSQTADFVRVRALLVERRQWHQHVLATRPTSVIVLLICLSPAIYLVADGFIRRSAGIPLGLGCFVLATIGLTLWLSHRRLEANGVDIARAWLDLGRCAQCAYDLRTAMERFEGGSTVCPECGAAWRMPAMPPNSSRLSRDPPLCISPSPSQDLRH